MTTNRPLRVFLCHSSNDKPAVRELYQKLRAEPWIQPWLDEEELYPGQDWEIEIEKAVESSDVVLVCLSNGSINKRGFVQKELRFALDVALEMPEETTFIIPLRLEECTPPRSLRDWQYADYFAGNRERALQRLLVSLKRRSESLALQVQTPSIKVEPSPKFVEKKPVIETPQPEFFPHPTGKWISQNKLILSNGIEFMRVPAGKFIMGSNNGDSDEKPLHTVDIPYDYWMARFPITNIQYSQFNKEKDFSLNGEENHPVVGFMWDDAMEYCEWLNQQIQNSEFRNLNLTLRLPTEEEWEKAARGTDGREYPWGNNFDKNKCNTSEGGKGFTSPIDLYSPRGDSPYGCADMAGNVWELCDSLYKPYLYKTNERDRAFRIVRVLRGGSWSDNKNAARCASRYNSDLRINHYATGFRVVASPISPE